MRLRNRIVIVATAVLGVGGIIALVTRRSVAPAPNLAQVQALARAGQFSHAQMLLDRYLQAHAENERARLLMAQLTTESTNSQPRIALEQLAAIQTKTPKETAKIKFLEGKAHYQQGRYDLAEDCWTEALRLDPMVPEAGWVLIDLLDKEGRQEEAHRLGMRLHQIEPDPRDRVKILLEMSRLDIEMPDPVSQVPLFEPLVKEHPENLPLSVTLGLALIRANRGDEGIEILHEALRRHPDSAKAWDAWLTGLFQASETEMLAQEFARLPKAMAANPQFAKHEGMIAQIAKDWRAASRAFGRAFAFEPYNWGVCYRLDFVLRQAGDSTEYDRIHRIYETYKTAYNEMRGSFYKRFEPGETSDFPAQDFTQQRGAYYETLAIKTLGVEPRPKLYQRLADLREKMGRLDEAQAWHRLVLRDSPDDVVSLAALKRLE